VVNILNLKSKSYIVYFTELLKYKVCYGKEGSDLSKMRFKKIGVIFYSMPRMDKAEKKKTKEVNIGYMFSPDNPVWHCSNCGYEWK